MFSQLLHKLQHLTFLFVQGDQEIWFKPFYPL